MKRPHCLLAAFVSVSLIVFYGCGSPQASSPSPAPNTASASTSATASPSTSGAHLIEITVSGRKVSPAPGRVGLTKGEKVRLVVHSDVADEIHVHGFDLEAKVAPGQDAIIEFVADQTGLFEVETHDSDLLLTQLLVK